MRLSRCSPSVRRLHAAAFLMLGVFGVAGGVAFTQAVPQGNEVPEAALSQARQVTRGLSSELQKLLSEELAKGGFVGAVKVCSEKAQTVSGEFNAAVGASARRVSLRYRNPNDQPDTYEAAMLRRWQQANARQELPDESAEVVEDSNGVRHLRYMKPILVQAMCLTCHGPAERIPQEVRAILGTRYPKDLATGYAAGDLRGAVSVRIPLNGN